MNNKLQVAADANCHPVSLLIDTRIGQYHIGAAALPADLRKAQWLPGEHGYDADWFRNALQV